MKFRTDAKIRDFPDCGQAQNESSAPTLSRGNRFRASETTTIFDERLAELFAELRPISPMSGVRFTT